LFYWLTVLALVAGIVGFVGSYLVGFIPMLKAHAMILKYGGLVLIVGSVYFLGSNHGYQKRVAEDQAEIERLNGEALAKTAELTQKMNRATDLLRKAKNDIQSKQTELNARVDSGSLRLPSSCGVQANSGSSSVNGDPANVTDTERQTIKALIALTSEGDIAITSLNSCINSYNEVMKTVNEGVK
jgi:hypothetical protein